MAKKPVVILENEENFVYESERYGDVDIPVYAVGVDADNYEEAYALARRKANRYFQEKEREAEEAKARLEDLLGMLI